MQLAGRRSRIATKFSFVNLFHPLQNNTPIVVLIIYSPTDNAFQSTTESFPTSSCPTFFGNLDRSRTKIVLEEFRVRL